MHLKSNAKADLRTFLNVCLQYAHFAHPTHYMSHWIREGYILAIWVLRNGLNKLADWRLSYEDGLKVK